VEIGCRRSRNQRSKSALFDTACLDGPLEDISIA
jgi:hypothetical protein